MRVSQMCVWLCATDNWPLCIDRLITTGFGWSMALKCDVVKLLIESGAGLPVSNYDDIFEDLPLHSALKLCKSEFQAIKKLLDFPSFDLNVRDSHGDSLLHSAMESHFFQESTIQHLIERGIKVDVVNSKEKTPLHTVLSHFFKMGFG